MVGTTMEEMRELLSYGHDIEFTYRDEEYMIQEDTDGIDDKFSMLVWKVIPGEIRLRCLYKDPLPEHMGWPTPNEYIDAVLNAKCIDGKSFMEIEEEVTVDAIL